MTRLGQCRLFWIVSIAAACGWVSTASGDDWPQWQGPDRNAVSKERGLLQEWPKDGPPLAWRIKGIGGGDGAPAIAAGKIYGMGTRGSDETVFALSEKDGSDMWVKPMGAKAGQLMPQSKEGPACTPTVDKDRLYVITMAGDVACLKAADGEIVWRKSFTKDFGGQVPMWSYRESPLVDGDKVICTPGGPDALIVALNKSTGETIWKSQLPKPAGGEAARPPATGKGRPRFGFGGLGGGAAYSSVIAVEVDGQRQYVQLTAKALVGVAAADGKFLWRFDPVANAMGINCSTPVYYDGQILGASAYGAGGGLVKLIKKSDGQVEADEVWFSSKMQNHHGGMIIHDGSVYGANGGNGGGNLICLDVKTGEVNWEDRDRRAPKGSIAFADGRLYYRVENGTMLLIEPNGKEYIERGRFSQPDRTRSPAWAHPVIANGKLYVRDQDALFCYDITQK